jgi:hypothetical protein
MTVELSTRQPTVRRHRSGCQCSGLHSLRALARRSAPPLSAARAQCRRQRSSQGGRKRYRKARRRGQGPGRLAASVTGGSSDRPSLASTFCICVAGMDDTSLRAWRTPCLMPPRERAHRGISQRSPTRNISTRLPRRQHTPYGMRYATTLTLPGTSFDATAEDQFVAAPHSKSTALLIVQLAAMLMLCTRCW